MPGSAVEREELCICWHVFTLHTENQCFGSVKSSVIMMVPTPTNSCFIDLLCPPMSPPSQSTALHQRLRRHSPSISAGLFFSVFSFCSPFGLALVVTLVEFAVFHCVARTSAHEACFSFFFANSVSVHGCRTCTVGFRLHSSTNHCRRFGQTEETLTC